MTGSRPLAIDDCGRCLDRFEPTRVAQGVGRSQDENAAGPQRGGEIGLCAAIGGFVEIDQRVSAQTRSAPAIGGGSSRL